MTEFLTDKGLGAYCSIFEEHHINGEVLLEATDEVLKEVGITRAIDRTKIRVGFRKFVHGPTSLSLEYPVGKVVDILKSLDFKPDEVERYCDTVQSIQIDGEFLKGASVELVRELGMKPLHYRKVEKKLT